MSWLYTFAKDMIAWIAKLNPWKKIRELEKENQLLKAPRSFEENHEIDEKGLCWMKHDPWANGGKTLVCKRCVEVDQKDIRLITHTNSSTGEQSVTCDQCRNQRIIKEGKQEGPPRLRYRPGT